MSHFTITMTALIAIILIVCCLLAYLIALELGREDQDYIAPPKRKPLKRRGRSLSVRLRDFWAYWRAGMSARNAWERAGRVL
jgi:ABC-type Fe3+ transport system permease subunit